MLIPCASSRRRDTSPGTAAGIATPYLTPVPTAPCRAVIFGQFGNRIDPSVPGAVYVTRVDIVDDGTPLHLVGPKNRLFNAVGLTYDASGSPPYGPNAVGPKLVAAKISKMDASGEYTAANGTSYPNDCVSIYGAAAAYRLRMYTAGGFSPDGVSGLVPTDFESFFRVHVTPRKGAVVVMNETGKWYHVRGAGKLKILGLADLGAYMDSYEPALCYQVGAAAQRM